MTERAGLTPVQTQLFAQDGMVIIQHTSLIGTQLLRPAEARNMAGLLLKYAEIAEDQARAEQN